MPVTQFEKMDAKRPGEPGGQGEYKVQTGFGWSNGVVLQFLQQYGWQPQLLQERKPWLPEVGSCIPLGLLSVILRWGPCSSCCDVCISQVGDLPRREMQSFHTLYAGLSGDDRAHQTCPPDEVRWQNALTLSQPESSTFQLLGGFNRYAGLLSCCRRLSTCLGFGSQDVSS